MQGPILRVTFAKQIIEDWHCKKSYIATNIAKQLKDSKTLPEAQRTQGIESLISIILLDELNLYPFQITQFLDSIA